MLFLHQANRLENLFNMLTEQRATSPDDPFEPEIIIVQNPGMANWLSQQTAIRQSIAANIHFPLPARFIWDIISAQGDVFQDDPGFTHAVMRWRILGLLPSLVDNPQFSQLKAYLQDTHDLHKPYQLACKISDLFDQYLVYRPDMLLNWEQGSEEHWQAELWRQLTISDNAEKIKNFIQTTLSGNLQHRARLLEKFRSLAHHNRLSAEGLARRIFLFGISSLAPVYLEIVAAISALIDVHIFHLNPCHNFWEDLVSDKELAKRRTKWRRKGLEDASSYFDQGNSLLASLGTVGAEFNRQLMDLELYQFEDYQSSPDDSLLARIQNDILTLQDPSMPDIHDQFDLSPTDRSIQFHICHSPLREAQVLHDRLLDLFETNPDLTPGDILVMAPDMERYSAAVAGTWETNDDSLRIPWSLADRSHINDRPIIRSFLELMQILTGRFTGPEIIALLETEAVRNRFDIDEQGANSIRLWIRQTGICWGLDSEHRHALGIENSDLNTWRFGLDRMLLGYITGPLDDPYNDILPWPGIRDSEADLLGSLCTLLDRLWQLHLDFSKNHTPDTWSKLLSNLVTDFFLLDTNENDQESITILRDVIADLEEHCKTAGFNNHIDLTIILTFFKEALSTSYGGQAFLTGRVTFCNMVPMRSIPFRVICLLGMNDGDYPRSQHTPSFDLITSQPKTGDRNRRNDDRYLFLESLLSARDIFYISWVGRSQNDNAVLTPSVVIDELRNYIDRSCNTILGSPVSQLTTEYPLQPFSISCFEQTSASWSYAAAWMPPTTQTKYTPVFLPEILEPTDENRRQVDINNLSRFWSHPVRFFLQERIGLQLWENEEDLPESEPFDLNHLEQYALGREVIQAHLNHEPPDRTFLRLQKSGSLPHQGFGDNFFNEMQKKILPFTNRVAALLVQPLEPFDLYGTIGAFTITGRLDNLYLVGRITYRHAQLKTKDLLQLWIHHLALNFMRPANCQPVSIHVATDRTILLHPPQEPEKLLFQLLELYFQGLSQPLHFYPETSCAWFLAAEDKKTRAAETSWDGGYQRKGEKEDAAYQIGLRGDSALDKNFIVLTQILSPLFKHLEDLDATA
jgi:exodeoxyribonuclease V gamma subunit